MTKQQKLEILENAVERAYDQISATPGENMASEDFMRLMEATDRLTYMAIRVEESSPVRTEKTPEPVETHEAPSPAPVCKEPSEQETTSAEEEPEPSLTKAEMVTRLSELGDACPGDNVIPGVMKDMGYEKLSQVPASQYAKLLEKAEAAVKAAKEAK